MKNTLVAGRYARAFYEISEENNCKEDALKDMKTIQSIIKRIPSVRDYCLSVGENIREQKEFINITFIPYVTVITKQLLNILINNKRLFTLPFLPAAFENIHNKKENIISANIESAHELSEPDVLNIKNQMQQRTGKKVELNISVIPELLGGFRIIWQNRILDFSAKGRLNQLRRLMSGQVY